MKFSAVRRLAVATMAAALAILPCGAQSTAQGTQSGAAPVPSAPAQSGGRVIFSRSTNADGQTVTQVGPAAGERTSETASKPSATDAERRAVTFTSFDLDVHLQARNHQMAVRALLTVRNDGKVPLAHIPLQISSSLQWDQVRIGGQNVAFPVARLNSDADHTGQLNEAGIPLARPLAPGASLRLDVAYSGYIEVSARRLVAIGAPGDQALHSDWDRIGVSFTGLRGFGNVVWYPVSSVPVLLGNGAQLFHEIGAQKQRLAGARFRLHLTDEFPHGEPPTVALINGHPATLAVKDAGGLDASVSGIATAAVDNTTLDFETPSLFLAVRKAHAGTNLTAWTRPENDVNVESWLTESAVVSPFVQRWLGAHPHAPVTLLDLPDPDDAPFGTGAILVANLRNAKPAQIDAMLVHALACAWMPSTHAWLNEGVAFFMNTLWTEKQEGRARALEMLEAERPALAMAEPSSPGESPGQPLPVATLPIYYRTKAAYVFWMLRDLAGDAALSAAFHAYDPAHDPPDATNGDYFESLLSQAGADHDLGWFFADWVNADKGLPDLSVKSVYPSPVHAGSWLVGVEVANSGYAAADVPVSIRAGNIYVTERMRIPARGSTVKHLLMLAKPREAQVNDGVVPEVEASVHVTHLTIESSSTVGTPP